MCSPTGFFKRTVRKDLTYACREDRNCMIDKRQRKFDKFENFPFAIRLMQTSSNAQAIDVSSVDITNVFRWA